MKSLRRTLMLAGALCASLAAGAACAADRQGRHRRHRRHVGALRRRHRRRRHRGDQDGDRRFWRNRARPADRGPDLRSSEQARHRRAETARMGRHRRPDDAARRLEHRGQPRHVLRGQGEEDPVHRHRRGRRVADRQGLHALYDPLRLRHDRARQRHRQDHCRRGRQELVLPHRRLRLREATGGGGHRCRQGGRRNGGRRRSRAARHVGLLLLSPPGAGLRRASARPRQRRRRHVELAQGGGGIRPHQDDEARGAARCSSPTFMRSGSTPRRASC